jgi:hypothetical protein
MRAQTNDGILWVAAFALAFLVACEAGDGGVDESESVVQRNPDVSTDERHGTSQPVRDIPPQPHPPGQKVHEVKPIPRPHRDLSDAGATD